MSAVASIQNASPVPSTASVSFEIAQSPNQSTNKIRGELLQALQNWVSMSPNRLYVNGYLHDLPALITQRILYVRCVVRANGNDLQLGHGVHVAPNEIEILFFVLHDEEDEDEELDPDQDAQEGEAPVTAGTSRVLPHVRYDKTWENLYYDSSLKFSVLDYAETALEFAQCGIPADVVNCNRLILLHGPPGTGKTTFCQAIAQKVAIRFHATYPHAKVMEINSHSLFSKWFSESGKLVQKLFQKVIDELEDDPQLFYCVLIDEVESIASSRSHGGSDPQDAVRAGNAVLTQLDRLKKYPNVLVLCTSNLTEMIDAAFSDRVDLKIYIGPPNVEARYEILRSQVLSLLIPSRPNTDPLLVNDQRLQLTQSLPNFHQLAVYERDEATSSFSPELAAAVNVARSLRLVATKFEGSGGRILRRAPLRCLQLFRTSMCGRRTKMTLSQFLQNIGEAIQKEKSDAAPLTVASTDSVSNAAAMKDS